jgi:two-component system sensor histidine kinase RegB
VPGLLFARSLIDLLDNAVEAVPAGAAIIHITIGIMGENARIDIEDCGPGIADEVKAQIGKPFVTTRLEGAGLGLFTAQSLAEALGGNLEVRDRVGGGTVVTLTLPVCGESP